MLENIGQDQGRGGKNVDMVVFQVHLLGIAKGVS
jgi:hypothetical protein